MEELLDEYLEHKGPSWSLSSRRDYASRVERIKADPSGDKPLSRVSVSEVDRWHLRMHKAGVGESQIRNLHTLLRAAFNQAVTVDRTHPVGDPDRLQVTPTKTGEQRGLALDEQTLALVEAARAERSDRSPWMFGEDGFPPSPDKIGWCWKRTRKLAEIDPKWRLHDLRHWSATHAIAGGHNVRSVAALGHSDPTTTMRTYAHALEGLDQGIADTVAGVLDGEAEA